jgi:hypothetical protein
MATLAKRMRLYPIGVGGRLKGTQRRRSAWRRDRVASLGHRKFSRRDGMKVQRDATARGGHPRHRCRPSASQDRPIKKTPALPGLLEHEPVGGWGGPSSGSLLLDSWSWQNVRPSTFTNCNDFIALRDRVRPFQTRRLRTIHEGGRSHAAKPAPASRPNAKTATPVITWPGVRDAKVQCVARRGSAMGTR